MALHDLILIVAGFAAGFAACKLLHIWADRRAEPYRIGWEKSSKIAQVCLMNEAYRKGLEQADARSFDAPVPYQW